MIIWRMVAGEMLLRAVHSMSAIRANSAQHTVAQHIYDMTPSRGAISFKFSRLLLQGNLSENLKAAIWLWHSVQMDPW